MQNRPWEVIEIDSDTDEDLPVNDFFSLGDNVDLSTFGTFLSSGSEEEGLKEEEAEQSSERLNAPLQITDPKVLFQMYLDRVLEVFPDISHDHLRLLYETRTHAFGPQRSATMNDDMSPGVIMQILDGGKYPKEQDVKKNLKRKREEEEDCENEYVEWTARTRPRAGMDEIEVARSLLREEFANIPHKFIDSQLQEHGHLFQAYVALEAADRTYLEGQAGYQRLKSRRKRPCLTKNSESKLHTPVASLVLKEYEAVKSKRAVEQEQRRRLQSEADADAARDQECINNGDVVECQCCFTDTPLRKATHCDETHFFCFDCARSYTKSQMELSRYKLCCMDGSGCKAVFTREQKIRFLDDATLSRIENLQQQDELRIAAIQNVESCPFCDYAEIYPEVELNREFVCKKTGCEKISCRLCRQESHIPKTCEEAKKENGIAERHEIEEAMTKALVKSCPKCGVPVIKGMGCNKMSCEICHTMMCDVCGKDITKVGYKHFTELGPNGGKPCPTYDDLKGSSKADKVAKAERESTAKIRAENPGISVEDLKIRFSETVKDPQADAETPIPELLGGLIHHAAALPLYPPARARDRAFLNDIPHYVPPRIDPTLRVPERAYGDNAGQRFMPHLGPLNYNHRPRIVPADHEVQRTQRRGEVMKGDPRPIQRPVARAENDALSHPLRVHPGYGHGALTGLARTPRLDVHERLSIPIRDPPRLLNPADFLARQESIDLSSPGFAGLLPLAPTRRLENYGLDYLLAEPHGDWPMGVPEIGARKLLTEDALRRYNKDPKLRR